MKSVFGYEDFREFLRDVHDSQEKEHSKYSWRAIARRANINNPNFLRQVMLGDRNLSAKTIESVGRALGLLGRDLEYWHKLVNYCQAPEGIQKDRYQMELAEMRSSEPIQEISSGFSEYYSHWYIPAIRELVTLYDFKDDYALLATSLYPAVSAEEAKAAIQILSRFHFIEKDERGKWVETNRALRSGTPTEYQALRNYHCEMLNKSAYAMRMLPRERRFVGGMTIGISKTCYCKILAEAEKFKNKVNKLVLNDPKSDTVMQIALQIFPTGATPESDCLYAAKGKCK